MQTIKGKNAPNAKKKVKIAEKTLPRTTEIAELTKSLTFATKSPNEKEEICEAEDEERDGYVKNSIFVINLSINLDYVILWWYKDKGFKVHGFNHVVCIVV